MGGLNVKTTVKLDLHLDENKTEFGTLLSKLVRAATMRVQQLTAANLYAGIYAAPEHPLHPRTGFLVNSVYSQTGDGQIDNKEDKVSAANALNPEATTSVSDFEPSGPEEGKVGIGAEYGVYMEAYMPFLEPAGKAVQAEIAALWESL